MLSRVCKQNKSRNKWRHMEILEMKIQTKLYPNPLRLSRRGAVDKGVEDISTNLLVNIWGVARVRVPLVLSVGIWTCKNSTINT